MHQLKGTPEPLILKYSHDTDDLGQTSCGGSSLCDEAPKRIDSYSAGKDPDRPHQAQEVLSGHHPAVASNLGDIPNLLEDISLGSLNPALTKHLTEVQKRLNRAASDLKCLTFSNHRRMHNKRGISRKWILDGRVGTRAQSQRFLHKSCDDIKEARRHEFATLLANVLGLKSPVLLTHQQAGLGPAGEPSLGTSTPLLDEVKEMPHYEFSKASPDVLLYVLKSRWVNDVMGNLDVWWKQMLTPQDPKKQYDQLVQIDFDQAFCSMSPQELRSILTDHWGHQQGDIPLEDCAWRDRDFDFSARVGWAPEHYDGRMGYYAPLWRAYLTGEVELDLPSMEKHLEEMAQLPKRVIENAMRPWLESLGDDATVRLPGSTSQEVPVKEFKKRLVERVRRSTAEFGEFLQNLKEARADPQHPLSLFYQNLPKGSY
jgi:hypothetical protein